MDEKVFRGTIWTPEEEPEANEMETKPQNPFFQGIIEAPSSDDTDEDEDEEQEINAVNDDLHDDAFVENKENAPRENLRHNEEALGPGHAIEEEFVQPRVEHPNGDQKIPFVAEDPGMIIVDDQEIEDLAFNPKHDPLRLRNMNALDESKNILLDRIMDSSQDFGSFDPTGDELNPMGTFPTDDNAFQYQTSPSVSIEEKKHLNDSNGEISSEPVPNWPKAPLEPKAYPGLERLDEETSSSKGFPENEEVTFRNPNHSVPIADSEREEKVEAKVQARPQVIPARSFRVGWGPNGMLLCLSSPTKISVQRIKMNVSKHERNLSLRLLGTHQEHREKEKEGKKISPGLELCEKYKSKVRDELSRPPQTVNMGKILRYQYTVWDEIFELWSHLKSQEQIKVASLSAWLQRAIDLDLRDEVKSLMSERKQPNFLEIAFRCLTSFRRRLASQAAQKGKYWRLAVLISSAGSCQEDIRLQLKKWESTGIKKYIDPNLLKIYQLLCGNVKKFAGELPWIRALGLHLWYADKPWPRQNEDGIDRTWKNWKNSVAGVLQSYLNHVLDTKSPASAPKPPFMTTDDSKYKRIVERKSISQQERSFDVRFALLQLFVDGVQLEGGLASLLTPEKSFHSYLDYTLSWHMHEVLRRRGLEIEGLLAKASPIRRENMFANVRRENMFDNVANLIASYATELEALGDWKWAVYVLMDANSDDDLRSFVSFEHIVKSLIRRHVPSQEEEQVEESKRRKDREYKRWNSTKRFLEEKCNVPPEWIHEALAYRAAYNFREHIALDEFLNGASKCRARGQSTSGLEEKLWNSAHELTMRKLLPVAFSSEKRIILPALQDLAKMATQGRLRDRWAQGGDVILEYINAKLPGEKKGEKEKSLVNCSQFVKALNSDETSDNVWPRYAASEIASVAINQMNDKIQANQFSEFEELLCCVDEHRRLQQIDRLSLNYMSGAKFSSH